MPDLLIFLLFLLTFFAAILITATAWDDRDFIGLSFWLVPIGILIWMVIGFNYDWKYENFGVYQTKKVEDVDCILFNGKLWNLTKYFGRAVPEDTSIIVKRKICGPYCGIYYIGVEHLPYEFEVVEPNKEK